MPNQHPRSGKLSENPGPMTMGTAIAKPFHLLRYFVLISLLIILVTAILVQITYRRTAVNNVITLGEASNIPLAQTVMSSVRPQLLEFLLQMKSATPEEAQKQSLPPDLDLAIQRLISDSDITRIKIYNQQGVVVYSSLIMQVGDNQRDNPGVQSALNGNISSELIYSDSFNSFDNEPNESNLIQSYLPVMYESAGMILGVFEVYTDVNFLVKETERSQFQMLAILCGVFLLMFVLLVATVWRASKVMTRQDHIIHERTRMLEFLTAQMLTDQEIEKKNIAQGLHESVAQTLSGVKMRLETMAQEMDNSQLVDSFSRLTGYLDEAISETSAIATRLHPFSIDEFGLLETLGWFIKDMRRSHPQLSIELLINALEEDISRSLKTIIYRIVQDTLNNFATQSVADQIRISLRSDDGLIELELEENSNSYNSEYLYREILPMQERTLLSGGVFTIDQGRANHTYKSSWKFQP